MAPKGISNSEHNYLRNFKKNQLFRVDSIGAI